MTERFVLNRPRQCWRGRRHSIKQIQIMWTDLNDFWVIFKDDRRHNGMNSIVVSLLSKTALDSTLQHQPFIWRHRIRSFSTSVRRCTIRRTKFRRDISLQKVPPEQFCQRGFVYAKHQIVNWNGMHPAPILFWTTMKCIWRRCFAAAHIDKVTAAVGVIGQLHWIELRSA